MVKHFVDNVCDVFRRTQLLRVGQGSALGFRVEFWTYFIVSRFMILGAHGGHAIFPEFRTKPYHFYNLWRRRLLVELGAYWLMVSIVKRHDVIYDIIVKYQDITQYIMPCHIINIT